MPRPSNPGRQRNTRAVQAKKYDEALEAFLSALGIDVDTSFEVITGPSQTVVRHVQYTRLDNGTMSGDFWEDVIERGK